MKALIATLSLLAAEPTPTIEPADTLMHIDRVEVTASLKSGDMERGSLAATTLNMRRIERQGIGSIKDVSLIAPNFYQPDYGSSITSSIYVRGFGSRIDQPTLGVIIDDVPVMNKNAYDFSFYDVRRMELLRGPQGTLYGRNTSGGVLNITTLSPFAWQGLRFMAEYATLSSARASLSYYARPSELFGVS
ncbi:MAG: Plug domain-containing protein, partial [Alistipes sp.]|nr:Plug domain-containing protein [Alistipes sp.]